MNKTLLTIFAIAIYISGFGQSAKSVLMKTKMQARSPMILVNESTPQPAQNNAAQSMQSRHVGNGNQTSGVCNIASLGQAPNAFGASGGSRTQVSFSQALNTVSFI